MKKKIFIFCLFFANYAYATDMDFGTIEFSAKTPNTIHLSSSDSSLTCSNTTDYTCPSFGVRGSFLIPGIPGQKVAIGCAKKGKVNNGGEAINLDEPEINMNGSTYFCNGEKKDLLTHTLTGVSANDTVYMGGKITVPAGSPAGGHYDSYTGNGKHITLRYE